MKTSPYVKVVLNEAEKFGIKARRIGNSKSIFALQRKNKFTYVYQTLTELVSDPYYTIAANKFLTS